MTIFSSMFKIKQLLVVSVSNMSVESRSIRLKARYSLAMSDRTCMMNLGKCKNLLSVSNSISKKSEGKNVFEVSAVRKHG